MGKGLKKQKDIKTFFGNLNLALTCCCVLCASLTIAVGQARKSGTSKSQSNEQPVNSDIPQSGSKQRSDTGARSQVEVNKDRFSGATLVKLKPQVILDTPDHQLTMAAEAKLGERKQTGTFQEDRSVQVNFVSESKTAIDFDDRELHFIVDGEQVSIGKTSGGVRPYLESGTQSKSAFKFRKRFFAVFNLSKLQRIIEGRNIEMRLGKIELKLNAKLLNNLRAFVAAASSK